MASYEEIAPGVSIETADPLPEWAVKCPKCGARKNQPCTYLSTVYKWEVVWHSGSDGRKRRDEKRVLRHRAGDETERSHNERRIAFTRPHRAKEPVLSPSPAVMAFWDYDRREYRAMQAWLRDNPHLLTRRVDHPARGNP